MSPVRTPVGFSHGLLVGAGVALLLDVVLHLIGGCGKV